MTPSPTDTAPALHAALAREARLREALEECASDLESVASGLEGGEEQKLSPPEHWRKCADLARFAALSPSPLTQASAEVLEAAVEYPEHEVRRLRDATARYRSLLREGQEGGEG